MLIQPKISPILELSLIPLVKPLSMNCDTMAEMFKENIKMAIPVPWRLAGKMLLTIKNESVKN